MSNKIIDYDLILDFSKLFHKPIIIYGAGNYGKRIFSMLRELSVEISFFYDQKIKDDYIMNIPVITMSRLKEETQKEDYIIIISSCRYCDEMIDTIMSNHIRGDICTWYGVQTAIELNINNEVFTSDYKKKVLCKKDLLIDTFYAQYLLGCMYHLARLYQPILIYQPGKVGSTTIESALLNAGVSCVHFHWLESNKVCQYGFNEQVLKLYKEYAKLVHDKLHIEDEIKIITIVRDPIGKELSDFMQKFMHDFVDKVIETNKLELEAQKFVEERVAKNEEFSWFDEELKQLTGIDIFKYPFDKEKGYAWIKTENVQILVLKTEMLDNNSDIIAEFVGKDNVQMKRENEAKDKHYRYIYDELKKRFCLSEKIVNELYTQNPYMDHFYTKEEKKFLSERWKTI